MKTGRQTYIQVGDNGLDLESDSELCAVYVEPRNITLLSLTLCVMDLRNKAHNACRVYIVASMHVKCVLLSAWMC